MSLAPADMETPVEEVPQASVRIDSRILAQVTALGARRMRRADARALLPQCEPFVFLDSYRISRRNSGAIGVSTYTATEEACRGHFNPNLGFPRILPRVIMEEAAAQCGVVFIRSIPDYAEMLPIFSGGFRGSFSGEPVTPGDRLEIRVRLHRLTQDRRPIGQAHADIYLGKKKIGWTHYGFTLVSVAAFNRLLRRKR